MLYLGPVIFGFLIGFVVGIRVRNTSSINLTIGSYVIIFLVALIIAWQSGPYPFFLMMCLYLHHFCLQLLV